MTRWGPRSSLPRHLPAHRVGSCRLKSCQSTCLQHSMCCSTVCCCLRMDFKLSQRVCIQRLGFARVIAHRLQIRSMHHWML